MRIYAYNEVNPAHLEDVIADMRSLGAPTLRAVETAWGLVAIEGSHRLAAAEKLGLTPEIFTIDPDDQVDGSTLGDIRTDVWADCECEGSSSFHFTLSGAELAAFVGQPGGSLHHF